MTSKAFLTLITKDEYLPGIVVLNRSLQDVCSQYPLVAMITPNLDESTLNVLRNEKITTINIDPLYLLPEQEGPKIHEFDTRFLETWMKLRVFGLEGYEVC
jgi:hypothetical protein